MDNDIRPCPCCNGTDIESELDSDSRCFGGSWEIRCRCGVGCRCNSEDECIAAWNRRADAAFGLWRLIETAPKDGTNVLLVNRKGNIATGLWQGTGSQEGWWLRGGNGPNFFFNGHHGPSHWMPLPSAPEADAQVQS